MLLKGKMKDVLLHNYSDPTETYMVLKVHHSGLLKLLARLMILMLIFLVFFLFFDVSYFSSSSLVNIENEQDIILNFDFGMLFHDLIINEGILKTGSKAAFLANINQNKDIHNHVLQEKYNVDSISLVDLDRQQEIPDEHFDIIITNNFNSAQDFIDRSLKNGGIVAFNLGDNHSLLSNKPPNYKIIYLRKFYSPYIAMKKVIENSRANLSTQRKLMGCKTEARKAALRNLENVLLEPPRAASGKSSRYLKKTKFLPDLTGDSLESYPRRVFIDVGLPEKKGGSGNGWFAKNYPTRNLDFDMYKIETVTQVSNGKEVEGIGMSDWLRKNVKSEDYVVIKANIEVVEEMLESTEIRMVDELFMECKPRGHGGTKKAYWECLALYGRLRDEGVAVHQWWG